MATIADYNKKLNPYCPYFNKYTSNYPTSQQMRQLVSIIREKQQKYKPVMRPNVMQIIKYHDINRDSLKHFTNPNRRIGEELVLQIAKDIKSLTPATYEHATNEIIGSPIPWRDKLKFIESVVHILLEHAINSPQQRRICMDLCYTLHRAKMATTSASSFSEILIRTYRDKIDAILDEKSGMRYLVHRLYENQQIAFSGSETYNLTLYRSRMIGLVEVSSELYRLKLMSNEQMNALCLEIASEWSDRANLNGRIDLVGMNFLMITFGIVLLTGILPHYSKTAEKELPLHLYIAYLQKLKKSVPMKMQNDISKLEEMASTCCVRNTEDHQRCIDPRMPDRELVTRL